MSLHSSRDLPEEQTCPEALGDPGPDGLAAPVEDPGRRSALAAQRITALGEMTGGIAHDLRNILAVIQSGLSLARRFSNDPSGSSQALPPSAKASIEACG
jgi:hypothetical protein